MSFAIAIVILIASLSGLFHSSQKKLKIYLRYYFTRIFDKCGLIDYSQTYEYRNICKEIDKTDMNIIYLKNNLDLLNKNILNKLNRSRDNQTKGISENPPFPKKSYEKVNSIRQRLYNLALLFNQLEKQRSDTKQNQEGKALKSSRVARTNKTSFEINLPQNREIINKKLIIKNNGTKKIENPKVIVNDKKKWFDLNSIIQSIIKPNMTDEEKALSIWNFLNDNRYHFYPATESSELHNIVKYLNAYGYGFCDDTATNFYLLASKVGLKSRVWGLSGHVVSEVYFQNDWHLLDSDNKVFYLEKDNKTIASVNDIAKDPELIYRVNSHAKTLAKLYTTKENNYIGQYWMSSISEDHNMNFILRPEESFIASWETNGTYISYGRFFAHEPPRYGNGQFIYNLGSNNNIFLKNLFEKNNVKIIKKNGYTVLTASKSNQTAVFVIDFRTPYPITGANFEINYSITEDSNLLKISFSEDNRKWLKIAEFKEPKNTHIIKKDFTNYFPNGYAPPLYAYFLKFELLSTKSLSLTIKSLKVITNTQLAPHSLPELENGNNLVSYISHSPDEQSTYIEFQYSLGASYHSLMNPPKLMIPKNIKGDFLFNWNPPDNWDKSSGSIEYNFHLSHRDDFLVPLSPNFDIVTENNKFFVEGDWFLEHKTYYWRVRNRYKNEPWSNFAKPQQLVIGTIISTSDSGKDLVLQ